MTLRQRGVLGTRTLKGETVIAAAKGGRWYSAMATGSRHCALSPSYSRRERGKGRWAWPASQEGCQGRKWATRD
jgi:hypothetical protein